MSVRLLPSILGKRAFQELNCPPQCRARCWGSTSSSFLQAHRRRYATVEEPKNNAKTDPPPGYKTQKDNERPYPKQATSSSSRSSAATSKQADRKLAVDGSTKSNALMLDAANWEDNPDLSISEFSELPSKNFGVNQHMLINEEFKEALRQILWKFQAPIRYAFAYGSGVFPQQGSSSSSVKLHPSPPEAITAVQKSGEKMIDFIFGVSYTEHWHSLNLRQHRDHYSAVGSLGSWAVSTIQDSWGAGCYFNTYITVNGTLIKYGVINIDTLCRDLSEWNTLYVAGRLHKPVKILRDNPSVRLANQVNLISAVRTALLLLPPTFTERDLYSTIAGISYMGDPRMSVGGDDPRKVANIVRNQLSNFRLLYAPLIEQLPNISFNDPQCTQPNWLKDPTLNANLVQDMDPVKRGNMVRRLPKAFRNKLYFEYQSKFNIPRGEFNQMMAKTQDEDPDRIRRREGGEFDQRIAQDVAGGGLREEVRQVIVKTIRWPAFSQSVKGVVTAGWRKSWRYVREKRLAGRKGAAAVADAAAAAEEKGEEKQTGDKEVKEPENSKEKKE